MNSLALKFQDTRDEKVFASLLEVLSPLVFKRAFSILKDEEDAAEVSNDVLTQIYFKIDSFRRESKFSTWLFTLTTNAALMFRRKKVRRSWETLMPEEFWKSYGDNQKTELNEDLLFGDPRTRKALKRCGEFDEKILVSFYIIENTVGEIAEDLGLSSSATKARIFRAKQKFKKHYTSLRLS